MIKDSHRLRTIALNIMDKLQNLFKEITDLTTDIETNYPELYEFLGEDPMTITYNTNPNLEEKAFKDYLESLKQLLKRHLETHSVSKFSQ